jgi:hypothetical protein
MSEPMIIGGCVYCESRRNNIKDRTPHPVFVYMVTDSRYNNYNDKLNMKDTAFIGRSRHPEQEIDCHRREPGRGIGAHCKPTSAYKDYAQIEFIIPATVHNATEIRNKWRSRRKIKSRLLYATTLALMYGVPLYCRDVEWNRQFVQKYYFNKS